MATIDAITNATVATDSRRSAQALSNEDFMKLMITELTNQDPFEPMSNQDLVNQMSTIQQMQTSMEMTESFESLMGRYDELLLSQAITSASGLVGQLVSGVSTAGDATIGTVLGVSITDGAVVLELDTGEQVRFEEIVHMGGQASQELIGQLVLGQTIDNNAVVGRVTEVDITGDQVLLILDNGESVTLPSATPLNADNVSYLIGAKVRGIKLDQAGQPLLDEGNQEITLTGTVTGCSINADGVNLDIDTGAGMDSLPLAGLRELLPSDFGS